MTDWTSLNYVVVDIEGNGQQPPDLVELAIVPIEGGKVGEPKSWLVRPSAPITGFARRIHGINDDQVATAPVFEQITVGVRELLDDAVFVAHNAPADLGVLRRKMPGWEPVEVVDTVRLARRLRPGLSSYRLGALVEAFSLAHDLPTGSQPHRATYDALVTARLFVKLVTETLGAPLAVEELRGNQVREGGDDEAPALF